AGGHDLAGRGLVAARGQHHAVDRVAVEQLDEPEIEQVAVERGSGPAAVLENRMDRKLDRYPARIAYPVACALGEVEMDTVARAEIAARLRDADDRPARLQLLQL